MAGMVEWWSMVEGIATAGLPAGVAGETGMQRAANAVCTEEQVV